MTVKELIQELEKFPSQTDIRITWEGIFRKIDIESLYLTPDGILIIDADDNGYKEDIMSGKHKVW